MIALFELSLMPKKCERNPANVAYIAGAEQNQNSKAMQINTPAAAAKRAFVWQK